MQCELDSCIYQQLVSEGNLLQMKSTRRKVEELSPVLSSSVRSCLFQFYFSYVCFHPFAPFRHEVAEQPLMTQSLRRQQMEAKMSRYKRFVIRIQFPDRLVIQGLFRPNETGEL
jgi:hypothetical protein